MLERLFTSEAILQCAVKRLLNMHRQNNCPYEAKIHYSEKIEETLNLNILNLYTSKYLILFSKIHPMTDRKPIASPLLKLRSRRRPCA